MTAIVVLTICRTAMRIMMMMVVIEVTRDEGENCDEKANVTVKEKGRECHRVHGNS